GFRENALTARSHCRRDQYRSDCRVAGGTSTGPDADLALCGTGPCARPALGAPRCLSAIHTPLPDCFAQYRQHISVLYYKNYYCNTKSREARLGGALVSYKGLTNSMRADTVGQPPGAE